MTLAISEAQLTALWFDEFASGVDLRMNCILCGNSGEIDTLGKVFNARGEECGGKAFCICPNGRKMKKQVAKASA